MIEIALLIVGFILMILGATFLVDGSKLLAKKFGISDLVVGLTILAFGTSLPELIVSLLANSSGSSGLTVGNIIGSNIANILLIVGATAIVAPVTVKSSIVWNEIPFSFLGIVILGILASDIFLGSATTQTISRADGLVLLGFFLIYLYHLYTTSRLELKKNKAHPKNGSIKYSNIMYVYITGGILLLLLGGQFTVENAESIAIKFGLSETVIGLTVLAIGTSLPELITTLIAAYKKERNLAIGNIIGSNIFNIFWILGFSSFISPIEVQSTISIDLLVLLIASFLMFLFLFIGKTKRNVIDKYEGLFLLTFFFSYLIFNALRV